MESPVIDCLKSESEVWKTSYGAMQDMAVGDGKRRPRTLIMRPAAPPNQIFCRQLRANRYRSDSGVTDRRGIFLLPMVGIRSLDFAVT